ncbi:hypothetical protein K525DRAFT_251613 [Schizophyllum commune Loenen D]|nr:hypothetical protein K525DRAFT_251613 [Schizophyllum commune Loenen D]
MSLSNNIVDAGDRLDALAPVPIVDDNVGVAGEGPLPVQSDVSANAAGSAPNAGEDAGAASASVHDIDDAASDSSDDVDIVMDNAASAAPVTAAPAAPAMPATQMMAMSYAPRFVDDPNDIGVGLGYLVTPNQDLVAPAVYWPPGPNYYAVTRGRFTGVFNNSAHFTGATNGVSSPIMFRSRHLHEVLDFFNTARRAHMLVVV